MLPRVDLIRTADHDWLLLNNDDIIGTYIREHGHWGSLEYEFAKRIVANRGAVTVIDAGANLGGFALPMATHLAEQGGQLHAFEPQRIVFQQLCANVFLNRLDNVHAHAIALGASAKSLTIPELDFWQSHNAGAFSLDPALRDRFHNFKRSSKRFLVFKQEGQRTQKVAQKRLDDFQFDLPIAFIKADIEGYELEMFKGAQHILASHDFPPIFFELWANQSWYAEKANETKSFLESMGYRIEPLPQAALALHPDHPYPVKVTRSDGHLTVTPLSKTGGC